MDNNFEIIILFKQNVDGTWSTTFEADMDANAYVTREMIAHHYDVMCKKLKAAAIKDGHTDLKSVPKEWIEKYKNRDLFQTEED